MFDVAPTEFLLVAVIALLVIGPKDLPKAMRVVGYWVGRMRGVARQFRSGFDNMVREAELEEMEKRWAAENARIMREHKSDDAAPAPAPAVIGDTASKTGDHDPFGVEPEPLPDEAAEPVYVEKPEIRPAPSDAPAARSDGVTS